MRVFDFPWGLTLAYMLSSGDAPGSLLSSWAPGGACLSRVPCPCCGARSRLSARGTHCRRGPRGALCSALLGVLSSVPRLNLGGARPGFRPCPDYTSRSPAPPRHRGRAGAARRESRHRPPSLRKRRSRCGHRHISPWARVPGCYYLLCFAWGSARSCLLRGPRAFASEAPR